VGEMSSPDVTPPGESSSPQASVPMTDLVPVVYQALRRLAESKLRSEPPGLTLQATALVHEAYLRLVHDRSILWSSPGHFYAAAAEAMRRILVERARRCSRLKHGRGLGRITLDEADLRIAETAPEILALDEALVSLEKLNPRKAELIKLRYFVGMTIAEAAEVLSISPATAKLDWAFARAWLEKAIRENDAA
jgi:RNA polymerase sigma factor (TIGR02999 family)